MQLISNYIYVYVLDWRRLKVAWILEIKWALLIKPKKKAAKDL